MEKKIIKKTERKISAKVEEKTESKIEDTVEKKSVRKNIAKNPPRVETRARAEVRANLEAAEKIEKELKAVAEAGNGKKKFSELGLSKNIEKALVDMGFEEASPIQTAAIPVLLKGQDVIAMAQTGTGKTAAFGIPVIENIDRNIKGLQAVILMPTRELVIQGTEELRKLLKYNLDIAVTPVYGGQEIERQFFSLKKNPQIIIGTPGRFMDHMRRGSIKMNTARMIVLDEADEMLDMGFREDIEFILKDAPKERQTIMFSATMEDSIMKLMKGYQQNPVKIDVTHHKINAPKIEQAYFEIQEHAKPEALARLLDLHNIHLALVFCNTRSRVDNLVENLKSRGYFAEGLHGDMSQGQRDKVMKAFRGGSVEILVATDVAGRGIDVTDVAAVFNYDLPRDDEDYVHRIGRTGRAGKSGRAFTFIVGREAYHLQRIERVNNMQIVRKQVPTLDDLDEIIVAGFDEKIKAVLEAGNLAKYINLAEKIMGEDFTAMDVAAAFIKIAVESRKKGFDEKVTFEAARESFGGQGGRRGGSSGGYRGNNRFSNGGGYSGANRFSRGGSSNGGSSSRFSRGGSSSGGASRFGDRRSSGSDQQSDFNGNYSKRPKARR